MDESKAQTNKDGSREMKETRGCRDVKIMSIMNGARSYASPCIPQPLTAFKSLPRPPLLVCTCRCRAMLGAGCQALGGKSENTFSGFCYGMIYSFGTL